ncbi:MAG TPA: hypothetical protein VJS66_04605, partial [Burkholderiales bacterium]|nr:hypothetical protein [Burkholderiales bacterium]
MNKKQSSMFFQGIVFLSMAFLAGCVPGGGRGTVTTVPVAPMCSILAVDFAVNPKVDVALVTDRTDTAVNHGFTRFRAIGGPRGNSAVGFTPDVYGISEAWSRNSAGPVVYRAQAHPARRPTSGDFNGSAWSINTQDNTGAWSPVIAAFSSTLSKDDQDDPITGGKATPQLMPVGVANPQVFGCAGLRSDDKAVRSTWLIEAIAPNPATGMPGSVSFIQDLLNGDDRFVPNAPGPLVGPATPPTPRITGRPGNPVREGSVKCAMTQVDDNLTTRELHMLAIHNGVLYHSMANSFGPATTASGGTFNRFRAVSPWGDVGQALGGGFGEIIAATVVASRPNAVSVFFVAKSGNMHKLWHAVRFSAGSGSWRAADDVLALNGGHPSGAGFPFLVAAGMCPVFGRPQDSELVYSIWDNTHRIHWVGRHVSTPQQWLPGMHGNYSPLFDLTNLLSKSGDTSRQNM